MNSNLISMEKSSIIESLETKLRTNQRKYQYHKRIADGYFDLVQQTMKQLEVYHDI